MMKPSGLILQLSEGMGLGAVVGGFVCIKNLFASMELCVDVDFEMIAVEVKGTDPKFAWEFIGMYRAPNNDMLAIEISTTPTLYMRNLTKRIILARDLNLPQAVWKGDVEKTSGFQAI